MNRGVESLTLGYLIRIKYNQVTPRRWVGSISAVHVFGAVVA